ncbi:MAG: class I SAM-dependent RNA methyltransferase [Dissulfurispiraceae bacterium]
MPLITIKAEIPAYGGRSISKLHGKVIMIKGAIPGETAEVKIEEEKKDYSLGTAVSIPNPSPDRCVPECGYFSLCGGCQLQFIAYSRQVRLKEEILRDCIKRIAKTEMELSPSIVSSSPWNYRLRGQFKIARGRTGFYKEKSREVVDIKACPLMSEEVNQYLAKARSLVGNMTAGEIHISFGGGAVALLKTSHPDDMDYGKLSRDFLDSGFSGVIIQMPHRQAIRLGMQYLTLDLENLSYTVSPLSFFQSNWSLNQAVVGFLKTILQPLKGKRVMDICSGAGNFSFPLAAAADYVVAVEESSDAVADGIRNAEINNIKNCTFINSSMDSAGINDNVDTLIVDPPRPGLTDRTIDNILRALPEKIAYISCNPTTLARDLKKLSVHYDIESIRMIDFFPQTYHIESLALLNRK